MWRRWKDLWRHPRGARHGDKGGGNTVRRCAFRRWLAVAAYWRRQTALRVGLIVILCLLALRLTADALTPSRGRADDFGEIHWYEGG